MLESTEVNYYLERIAREMIATEMWVIITKRADGRTQKLTKAMSVNNTDYPMLFWSKEEAELFMQNWEILPEIKDCMEIRRCLVEIQ